MKKGYLYRIARADAARVRELAGEVVGLPCWSFGGAALCDLDPGKGTDNLRPIRALGRLEDLDLRGDLGHIFSARAEVRWKRRDDGSYDVLVLSEQALSITGLQTLGEEWDVSEPPARNKIIQTGQYPPLTYLTYHAPNGAAQFVRYSHPEVTP
ncbi:MAG: hypothetical protein N2378_08125 [Chloroflexaceae bacterium]|nr:hypothetical protein [Chloroflexaceae bacterium]